jgi:putative LysE/RhtB family amino acid efflux pump
LLAGWPQALSMVEWPRTRQTTLSLPGSPAQYIRDRAERFDAHRAGAPATLHHRPVSYIPNAFFIVPVGVIAGVLLAMPLGPINLLGLQRAVERGFFGGLAAGIGILLADGLIAFLAALGVNAIPGAIREYRAVIQLLGGLALLVAGVRLYVTPASLSTHVETRPARLRDYAWDIPAMFMLTVTNPPAVLGLLAIYAGVSSYVEVETYHDLFAMVKSIRGGSFL